LEHDRTAGTLNNLEEAWNKVLSKAAELELLQNPKIMDERNCDTNNPERPVGVG